jgi:phage tail-like protein
MSDQPCALLDYLPAPYREDPFLGQFLRAFEALLFRGGKDKPTGGKIALKPYSLEGAVDQIAACFDPRSAREEFLPWLASWTAFALRFDLTTDQQRDFIARALSLYRRRGTKGNLETLLQTFTKATAKPDVCESRNELENVLPKELTERERLLGSVANPHFFVVVVRLGPASSETQRQIEIATAIVQFEKPAHTDFTLVPVFLTGMSFTHNLDGSPGGPGLRIGIDTILGTRGDGHGR